MIALSPDDRLGLEGDRGGNWRADWWRAGAALLGAGGVPWDRQDSLEKKRPPSRSPLPTRGSRVRVRGSSCQALSEGRVNRLS